MNKSIRSEFAPLLVRLREKHNLTQQEVAKKIGIKRSTYAAYEESRSQPGLVTLDKIFTLYVSKSLSELLTPLDK